MKGNYDALIDQEIEGLHLFRTKGKCINCHNLGYSSPSSYSTLDSGRHVATGQVADIGKFRTLGLRNVANTFPYWHNGAFSTLKEVIDAKNEEMP
ncbi:hypothetical protein [Sphingobacterium sp. LRF_L2]|uniref:hypothetical protein n=1 Tax=Sphingobacterium sp. LRF_L2 TaxID=3369421 RepID=UPI003F6312D0